VRTLVVGGGERALALTRALSAEGHAVRVVAREEERRAAIEAAGGECWIGDPDRIGTLRYALENVTVVLWLLGTVDVEPLHGSRLAMMLEKSTDTTIRGFVYEQGSAHEASGIEQVLHANRTNEIPYALLDADPADEAGWLLAARTAIDSLLGPRRASAGLAQDSGA
jgi:hypothetical protein